MISYQHGEKRIQPKKGGKSRKLNGPEGRNDRRGRKECIVHAAFHELQMVEMRMMFKKMYQIGFIEDYTLKERRSVI